MSLASLDRLVLDPRFHDLLSIVKGARNGFVYGVKIRLPHALVMSALFGKGDWKTRLLTIIRLTRQHATNLAKFVAIYKTAMIIQKRVNNGKERSADSFVAGLLSGYAVFGDRTAVNEQIVLYVCSRVVASFLARASPPSPSNPGKPIPPSSRDFSVFAAVCWGAVMWLFNHRENTIQPGMHSSMKYLYRDSNQWNGLRTLLWHNR